MRKESKGSNKKNKKKVLKNGIFICVLIGTGIGCIYCKNKKISFPEWIQMASIEELNEIYEKLRLEFCKTGIKPFGMERISRELGSRGAKEWFEKHPPNTDPNYRWTDKTRWDRD